MNKELKNEAVIQFSGGIDSLYVAYMLAQKYDRIHLLTFYKGYLHFGLNFSEPNIKNLKRLFGEDKIVFKVVNMKSLFKKMAVKNFFKDLKKFGNEISWCIPCRASMTIMSIIYAIENGIRDFTDGANWEQAPDQENLLTTADNYPGYLKLLREFSKTYNVNYFSPVYNLNTRKERRDLLLEKGFYIDWNSLDVEKPKSLKNFVKKDFYKRYQPMCISGWLIHWKRNLFNKKEDVSEEKVLDLVEPKLRNIGKEFIKDCLSQKKKKFLL